MDRELGRRARTAGVATEYEDQRRRPVIVPDEAVRKVLAALGDDAGAPATGGDVDGTAGRPAVVLPAGPRAWGWMVQLYAVPSAGSWGIGDLRDLRTLVEWTAARGGDLVLVNPLHAVAPGTPMQPSPYFPSSRRWTNPVYLRVEDTAEYAAADPALRERVDALKVTATGDRIDRDAAWAAKRAALELLAPESVEVTDDVRGFATWSALAEVHGDDWRQWPEGLRGPGGTDVAGAAEAVADSVRFHAWLQACCDDQMGAVHQAATEAGMAVGVVHDLAVGTDPGGADAWELQDVLALAAHIGAPPDPFNQKGQDWGMPPWHPWRLAELGYRPLQDLVGALLRHAGGVRIDHILGMFRAWWVPDGDDASQGTFVRYDAARMLEAITAPALEAGAVVVGEDLGTTPDYVRDALAQRGVLGTSVLWFEREDADAAGEAGPLRDLADWREAAMASVTTHDLPTALGWLRGEHVRVRGDLGLLDDAAAELESWRRERSELLALLRAAQLVGEDPSEAELVVAVHRAVARTPSRYVLAALGDVVGDLRQPNLPGTTDQYPSWQLAVTDAEGRVRRLEDLLADDRVERLAGDLTQLVTEPVR